MMISACIITYNHELYIRDCLQAAISQNLNCQYEIVIGEDCSTDRTLQICKEFESKYPNIIKLLPSTKNLGMANNWERTIAQCTGKYIAICEGDDFWIDPYKLQKQVMFLEQNKDYNLSYSYSSALNCKKNTFNKKLSGGKYNSLNELIDSNKIPTLTTVFRKDIHESYIKEINPSKQRWKMADYPFWIYCSIKGKVHFLQTVTGVYRILESSASHSRECSKTISFIESVYDIKTFFIKHYSIKYYSLDRLIMLKDIETIKALLRIGKLDCAINILKASKFKKRVILKLTQELIERIIYNRLCL